MVTFENFIDTLSVFLIPSADSSIINASYHHRQPQKHCRISDVTLCGNF